jgi:hypothetical protein
MSLHEQMLRDFLKKRKLALALLVARVLADHHDSTVTANHLALIADLLDARLNLHGIPLRDCSCGYL